MIRRLLPAALLLSACAAKGPPKYDNSLFELASGYAAKLGCSCHFVTEREDAACRDWTRVSPAVARYLIDEEARTVTAKALGMGRSVARYVDEDVGCVIVDE